MRKSTVKLDEPERSAVKEMVGIAIQQAYFTTEKELLRYKKYVNGKGKTKNGR